MIRTSTRQQIAAALDESYFGGANFSLSLGGAEHVYFSINFIPNPDYSFWVLKRESTTYPFDLVRSPGPNVLQDEKDMITTMEKCVTEIAPWISRIKEEVVSSNPLNREVMLFREEVEARLNAMNEAMEGFFTKAEAESLAAKLSALDSRLEALAAENVELSETSTKLRATVEQLQSAIAEVNKATWFRMAAGKLTAFTKSVFTSKEGREFALEAAKQILLDGPK